MLLKAEGSWPLINSWLLSYLSWNYCCCLTVYRQMLALNEGLYSAVVAFSCSVGRQNGLTYAFSAFIEGKSMDRSFLLCLASFFAVALSPTNSCSLPPSSHCDRLFGEFTTLLQLGKLLVHCSHVSVYTCLTAAGSLFHRNVSQTSRVYQAHCLYCDWCFSGLCEDVTATSGHWLAASAIEEHFARS